MHLFFMVRGVIHQFDLFKMFMQTQMFVLPRYDLKDKKTVKENILVQGGLRDLGFMYEYVFPEKYLAEVLTMLEITPRNNRWNIGDFKSWVIRKALGKGDAGHKVEPIPNYTPVITNRYVEKRGVAIYPIGIKKDGYGEMQGLWQELI